MENTKKGLRSKILTLLRTQKEAERLRKSKKIEAKLFRLPEFQKSSIILFYLAFDGEVETVSMIKKALKIGKKVALPWISRREKLLVPILLESLSKDLEQGPYDISQPVDKKTNRLDLEQIDLVVVPGLAFDKSNNRLGRGGGYYDRLLHRLPARIPTVGLAFDFQVLNSLPHLEKHDVALTHVLTN